MTLHLSAQGPTSKVQVIHNFPSLTVDVYANGALFEDDFAFRTATEFREVPAGVEIELALAPDTSTTAASAIVTFPAVTLEENREYVIIANADLDGDPAPVELVINDMGQSQATDPALVDVAVFHGSPDAPAVDVRARTLGTPVTNLNYGSFTGYLSLPPAAYLLDIIVSISGQTAATFKADLNGLAGGAATVFASGYLGQNPSFGLFAALPDGTVAQLSPAPAPRLVINEVDYDQDGSDEGEFIEIKNIGTAPANLAGTTLRLVNGSLGTGYLSFEMPDAVIAADGYYVVCFGPNNAEYCDTIVGGSIQNGAPDAIGLLFDGAPMDLLSYEGNVPGFTEVSGNGLVDDDNIPLAGLARIPDGNDTNNNNEDFGQVCVTPGAKNLDRSTDCGTPPTTRVQIIHNSPSPTVDIYADDLLLIDDFAFREATPFVDLPAETEINIGVALGNSTSSDDVLVTFPVTFEFGKTYVVTANGVVNGDPQPFTLDVNESAREAAADPAKVDVAVLHGSPNAPNVDVDARGIGNIIPDLAYGEYTDYLSLDPESYLLDIRAAGDPDVVATFEADLSGLAGGAATVFASGLLGGDPAFGLFAALPNGQVVELPQRRFARLQVIHNSPSPTVDVYANGELLIDDFEFRTATPFIEVPAEVEINIGVAPGSSTSVNDTLVNFPVTFAPDETYVAVADGVVTGNPQPFTLHVNPMGREAAAMPDMVDVAVLHGSPDAPNVDVDARGVGTLITDLAYGEFSDYLSVPPATYLLDILPTGNPGIVATFEADLSGLAGGAATVFASGFLTDDPAFGLFAALPNGVVIELPSVEVARLQVIHNSPSPTVDVYANDVLLIDDFEFREATPFIDVPAGVDIRIGIALSNSTSVNDTLVGFPASFVNGETYVVVATGIVDEDPETPPFNLAVFPMGQESAADDANVDLLLYHGSTDAPEVDVVVDANGAVAFDNVMYGEFQGYVNVPAGNYILNLTPAGDNNTVVQAYQAELAGLGGLAATVFASGFFSGESPSFEIWVALPDGQTFALPAVTTSVNNLSDRLGYYQVAPNPVNDMARIQYSVTQTLDLQLHLYDANGRLLRIQELGQQAPGEYSYQLEMGQLPQGVYHLSLIAKEGVSNKRIILTR